MESLDLTDEARNSLMELAERHISQQQAQPEDEPIISDSEDNESGSDDDSDSGSDEDSDSGSDDDGNNPTPPQDPFAMSTGLTSATFISAGPIGLRFRTDNKDGPIDLSNPVKVDGIKPDSQASHFPQIKIGMILTAVGNQSIAGMKYADVIEMIKNSDRPLTMKFADGAPPKPTDKTAVYNRIAEIFNGEVDGAGFIAAVKIFADKYLGTSHSGAMQTWMGDYLTDQRILTKNVASDEAGAEDYFDFTTPDKPGSNFGNYIDARAVLQKTITDSGSESEFEPLEKFATFQSAKTAEIEGEAEVKDIIDNRLVAMMRSVETKLLTYLPIESDIYPLTTSEEIMGAFKGVFDALPGTPSTTFGAENGERDNRIRRRTHQIIGSLYLENDADPKGVWDAFRHKDMGNPAEIMAWLGDGVMHSAILLAPSLTNPRLIPMSGRPTRRPTRRTAPISLSTVKVTHPPSFNILQLSEGTKPFSLTS